MNILDVIDLTPRPKTDDYAIHFVCGFSRVTHNEYFVKHGYLFYQNKDTVQVCLGDGTRQTTKWALLDLNCDEGQIIYPDRIINESNDIELTRAKYSYNGMTSEELQLVAKKLNTGMIYG